MNKMGKGNRRSDRKESKFGSSSSDGREREWDFKKIMQEVRNFSNAHLSFKERRKLEDEKLVSLGGKAPKKQRLPLSIARVQMKKQKEREQKKLQENAFMAQYEGKNDGGSKRSAKKLKPEDMVLKSTEGRLKDGVLDVKHLLHPAKSRDSNSGTDMIGEGARKKKMKGKGKKNKGKKKGGGRRRH